MQRRFVCSTPHSSHTPRGPTHGQGVSSVQRGGTTLPFSAAAAPHRSQTPRTCSSGVVRGGGTATGVQGGRAWRLPHSPRGADETRDRAGNRSGKKGTTQPDGRRVVPPPPRAQAPFRPRASRRALRASPGVARRASRRRRRARRAWGSAVLFGPPRSRGARPLLHRSCDARCAAPPARLFAARDPALRDKAGGMDGQVRVRASTAHRAAVGPRGPRRPNARRARAADASAPQTGATATRHPSASRAAAAARLLALPPRSRRTGRRGCARCGARGARSGARRRARRRTPSRPRRREDGVRARCTVRAAALRRQGMDDPTRVLVPAQVPHCTSLERPSVVRARARVPRPRRGNATDGQKCPRPSTPLRHLLHAHALAPPSALPALASRALTPLRPVPRPVRLAARPAAPPDDVNAFVV
jgi:hypothetical protein